MSLLPYRLHCIHIYHTVWSVPVLEVKAKAYTTGIFTVTLYGVRKPWKKRSTDHKCIMFRFLMTCRVPRPSLDSYTPLGRVKIFNIILSNWHYERLCLYVCKCDGVPTPYYDFFSDVLLWGDSFYRNVSNELHMSDIAFDTHVSWCLHFGEPVWPYHLTFLVMVLL